MILLVGEIETCFKDAVILKTKFASPTDDEIYLDALIPVFNIPVEIPRLRSTKIGLVGTVKTRLDLPWGSGFEVYAIPEKTYLAGPNAQDMNILIGTAENDSKVKDESIDWLNDFKFDCLEFQETFLPILNTDKRYEIEVRKGDQFIGSLLDRACPGILILGLSSSKVELPKIGKAFVRNTLGPSRSIKIVSGPLARNT